MQKLYNTSRSQDDLLQLSSTFSKRLKQRFGKGPETCNVVSYMNRLSIFVRNFITPAEEVLIEEGKLNLAYTFRNAVMESVYKEFTLEASEILNIPFNNYHYDWDYNKNIGIIVLIDDKSNEWIETNINPILKKQVFDHIIQISSEIHKIPTKMEMIKFNQNLYAIECHGTMLHIEKVLLKKGNIDLLQERSKEIKKSFLDNRYLFEKAFGRKIEGLFMTWDYKKDRNYIFYYLQ